MNRPVVVDPTQPNLDGARIELRCRAQDLLNRSEASMLCRRVAALYENQGAEVEIVDGPRTLEPAPSGDDGEAPPPTPDLRVDLRGRRLHQAQHPLAWPICIASFGLIPAVSESTFANEVTITDGDGFLLASRSLRGRLVHRFGIGAYVTNGLLDAFARDEDEKLGGARVDKHLSGDLYGQLSQITFDALVQATILAADTTARAAGEP